MNSSTFFSGFDSLTVQAATVIRDLPQSPVRCEVKDITFLFDDLLLVRRGAVWILPSKAIARGMQPGNTFREWTNCEA